MGSVTIKDIAQLAHVSHTTVSRALKDKKFGYTVAMVDGKITENPLGDVAMKTKFVPVDCKMVKTAKDIGISFGD